MAFVCHIFFIFYVIAAFLFTFTYGTCQCNQMLHPGVFSGEKMTFAAEGNHNRQQKRSDNAGKQSFRIGVISFEPPYLDFGEQPIGMPFVRDVMIFNPSNEKTLQLQTLSGDNTHFHASFSKPQALSPSSNTTFEVIFLARSFGNVENTLFIHTLTGAYPYQVHGFGVQNPYRLRPFLGARIALDYAFSAVINMYNPHNTMLQVTEIYSSGGDLHLELPTGEDHVSHKRWEIAPYETKAIIKLGFLGRVASNHTSFIRIRTNKFFAPKHFLILPVEVEVSSVPGIFLFVDQLDFGTLRRIIDDPKTIVVSLLNTGNKPVSLTDVSVDPPNRAISIDLKVSVIKHAHQYVKAFSVTYSASNVKSPKQHFGKIVIKTTSKSTPKIEINYQANVLQGTLASSLSKTRFFIGSPPYEPVVREIVITNTFTFPLVIHRVVVSPDARKSLSIVNFSSPIIVQEQKTVTPFFIRFLANKTMSTFLSSIRVYTNASFFTIPIHCYDGKLQFRLAESVIDFGTLAVTQKHHKVFEVANLNPVEVTVRQTTSNASLARLKRLEGDGETMNISEEEFSIKPGWVVKLHLDVTVPQVEGDYSGNISFNSTYESKVIMFSLQAASGRIEVDPVKIIFNPSFPGQIQKASLFLKSTFFNPVNVLLAAVKTEDKQFSFVSIKKSNAQLAPHNRQKIGDVIFDPALTCQPNCYLGVGNEEKAWHSSLSLPSDTARIDTSMLETSQTAWNLITNKRRNSFNSSLVIDTEAVKGVRATIEGSLIWPSLTSDLTLRFPLTYVGNVSRKTLLLENPADVPVVVQVVPLSIYPNAQSVIDVLSDRFDVDLLTVKPSYHSCFSLPTAKTNRHLLNKPSFGVTSSSFHTKLGVPTSPDVISLLIAPHSKAKVLVQFKPENEDQRTSIMFIRNNLTILDIVTIRGQGARGELMINGKRPSVDSVLLFELKQRHLADCIGKNHVSGGKPYRALTVKKTVLATNPGELATHVTSFSIDGYECEGYGFKVLNCRSVKLKPAASAKIDIAFTPDFSVSRVSRRLRIKTALGAVFEFSLIATIPSELIPLCAAATGRPVWEFHVYVSAIAVMFGLLMVVLVMAHFEASKLIATSFSALYPNTTLLNGTYMNGELFDLRKITALEPPCVSNNSYPQAADDNASANIRRPTKEVVSTEKTKARTSPQTFRRNASDSCAGLISNNNSICTESQENERNRDKVKCNDNSTKESGKKQRKSSSGNQSIKRKDSESEVSKPLVPTSLDVTRETMAEQVFQTVAKDSGAISPTCSRDSCSSSDANSVCCDAPTTSPSCKKEKSKVRKKTAKVSPAVITAVEEKRSKVKGTEKEKEKEKMKGKEKGKSNNTLENGKDKRNRCGVETKEESKEARKHAEGNTKTLKSQKEKGSKTRRVSLPVELEHANGKSKDEKSKSHQPTLQATNSIGKTQPGKSPAASSNKKKKIMQSNSVPAMTRPQRQTSEPPEYSDGVPTPHTISEAINSALERSLKHSPSVDTINQKSSPSNQSRCSSVSPSPPLSDSSQNLSQSSRSSSYSSVVGSEESVSASNEQSRKRQKQHAKAQKPSPLTIQKNTESSHLFATNSQQNAEINNLCQRLWQNAWDASPCEAKEAPVAESFPSASTSSSLFASTPFDKDGKLESPRTTTTEPFSEEHCQSSSGEKFPLYTFHDVKAPGLSTPLVETDTSVPKFWPDEPISSLESLIPNMKQTRNTNWVNFLDESSCGGSNLPSPGMPQGSKTVAEIWDAGQLPDDNDGWSTAFSPTFESELSSPGFSSCHSPYEDAWSTGMYQHDYYAMPTESAWSGANQATEAECHYSAVENVQCSSSSHKLNPYSQPWDASGLANKNRWSPGPAYRE